MYSKIELIENSFYPQGNPHETGTWPETIEKYFAPHAVEDISDIDRTDSGTYLLSLDDGNVLLSSENFDRLIERKNIYFAEIAISGEKPLATLHFWKYLRGTAGQTLHISSEPFLTIHKHIPTKFANFVEKEGLISLSDEELATIVSQGNKKMSLYYKYFEQSLESPLHSPYKIGGITIV